MRKNILLIGGAGYVGTELSKILVKNNYDVTVYDLFIYGQTLPLNQNNLKLIKGDIRDINYLRGLIKNFDFVIHLACISNDPSFDLDPLLGKSINFDPFEDLVKTCRECGVKRFIYASSSSVYGVKKDLEVTENASLDPLTEYSRFKVKCEEILYKYSTDNFVCTSVRPATVCGFSNRQRLDLVVNILTNNAFNKGEIIIFGGSQLRPNIHISDMCEAYIRLLNAEANLVKNESFNVGFENYTVEYLADLVNGCLGGGINIVKKNSDDLRSYHISSKKIKKVIGFEPNFTIKDGIIDLINAFKKKLLINPLENEMYFNIKRMKSINLK